MLNFLKNLVETVTNLVQLLITFVSMLLNLITIIPRFITFLFNMVLSLPPIFIPFAMIAITVFFAQFILGRNKGG